MIRDALDVAAVKQFDRSDMLGDVLAQTRHLREALDLVDSSLAGVLPDSPGGLVVCGVGGSGVAGDLAAAVVGPRARRPIWTYRGYAPQSVVGRGVLVLCPSYSGNTDITLACYRAAGEAGAARVALTSGGRLAGRARGDGVPLVEVPSGFQPRAAVMYAVVTAMYCASAVGAAPDLRRELESAADLIDVLGRRWGPDSPEDSPAKTLARDLQGRLTVVYGTDPTTAVAGRWKTQLNETGKHVAFSSDVLEANHHELCTWEMAEPQLPGSVIFLDAPMHQHPQAVFRANMSARLIARSGALVRRVAAQGTSRADAVLSLVLLADLVAVYLAVLNKADPSDIGPINEINAAVAQRWSGR